MKSFGKANTPSKSETPLIDRLVRWFEDDDWNFDRDEDHGYLRMGFTGRNGQWMIIADAKEQSSILIVYSVLTVQVPAEHMAAAAEFVARANYGLIIGNFELDVRDGEVRYKTSINVETVENQISDTMIRNLLGVNLTTFDRYLPGLMAVCEGASAEAEIAKCES